MLKSRMWHVVAMTWLVVGELTLAAMAADVPIGNSVKDRRIGRFADGGVYVGGTVWGGTLNHMRVSTGDNVNARLAAARNAGCLNVVQLAGEGNWSGDPAKRAAELAEWLKKTDMAKVDILMLGEEHLYDAGSRLDPLYDVVKEHCDAPVYVWPSAPLGPLGKADGYGYDNYGARYTPFRQKLMEFLSTGKPVVQCIDGSGYSDLVSAREQVMVCREFDVPAFYFIADSGSGGLHGWLGGGAVYVPWRNFVFSALEFQRRNAGSSPLEAGDMVWGEPIDLAGDYDGKIDYSWSGIGPATVYGFKRLKIDATGVRASGHGDVSLDYQFWSLLPVEKARLVMTLGASDGNRSQPINVELSRCGKVDDWRTIRGESTADGQVAFDLENPSREFRVRVTLPNQNASSVRSCQLTGRVALTEDRATNLGLFIDGWRGGVRYRQNLAAGLWKTIGKVDSPQALEPNGLALRGKAGGNSANIVQKFTSQKPLNKVVVRLTGQCNERNLGGAFSLGISLDGTHVIAQGVRGGEPVEPNGVYRGVYTADLADLPEFKEVKAFYVHLGQANRSGLATAVSSRLESLEIDAATGP